MAEEKQGVIIVIGTDEHGCKKLPARTGGLRESTQSRRELRRDLKRRGLKQDPKPANGDGASGFWTALRKVFATSQEHHRRCTRR
jgi:transposase-like protein